MEAIPVILEPHYPNIIVSFTYRGCRIQIDQDTFEGQAIYAAWVDHETGSAVADACALSRTEAVRNAKAWIDRRLTSV
ncbi:MAG: hypothetical protein ACFB8W_14750 [Elainellaceae cyanobacterium]